MKNYELAVEIDVSKKTLDVFIHNHNHSKHRVFDNTRSGYLSLVKWAGKFLKTEKSVLYCFEHTGNYSLKLAVFMQNSGLDYVQENLVVIKRSSGLVRMKTDRVDAQMIARYAWLHREELECSSIRDEALLELGRLLSLRDQLVRHRTGLMGTLEELTGLLSSRSTDVSCKSLKHTIVYLNKQVLKLEKQIDQLLKREEELGKHYKLLTSLKGVGRILACQLIDHSCNFQRFSNWRQFSSYCGTATFVFAVIKRGTPYVDLCKYAA